MRTPFAGRPRAVAHGDDALVDVHGASDALIGGLGLVAEDAAGSRDGDWDMLLQAAKRGRWCMWTRRSYGCVGGAVASAYE